MKSSNKHNENSTIKDDKSSLGRKIGRFFRRDNPEKDNSQPNNKSAKNNEIIVKPETATPDSPLPNTSSDSTANKATQSSTPVQQHITPTVKVKTSPPIQVAETTQNTAPVQTPHIESIVSPVTIEKNNELVTSNDTPKSVDQGLDKSRVSFTSKLGNLFKGTFDLDDDLFEDLEDVLISSDIGIEASLDLVENLRVRVKKDKLRTAEEVIGGLQRGIADVLQVAEQPWLINKSPYVILMVGVNGVGKTTTTAKIAHQLQQQGKTVMLAAADTFRAAAVEQLQEWGKRLNIHVVAQATGADAAAVAHDALSAAIARSVDVLIIDTAGRLHTQSDLMEQLQKVSRVLQKIDTDTPHEVMQILDAGNGSNALSQLEHFQKAVGVSSLCLTKLDGSAKGGVAIALSQKFKLPIRFIGVGEGFNDLQTFNAHQFANALISVDFLSAQ